MSQRTSGRRTKAVAALGLAAVVAAAFPMLASAETASPQVTATATPTSGLSDGDVIAVNVDAVPPGNPTTSQIFSVDARVCKPGASIDFSADFNPTQGGKCVSAPLSPGTSDLVQSISAPPFTQVGLNFIVGTGTDTYTTQDDENVSITCDFANPCKLVLKLQVPGGTEFTSFPLSYAAPATAPGAPTNFVGNAGDGTVALDWDAPASDGNSPIDYYTVTPSVGAPIQVNAPATNVNVTGLTNGTPYDFTVSAHNEAGFTSPVAGPITVTPNLVPLTAPTAVVGTPGDTEVDLSWTAPSSGIVDTYTVTPYIGGVAQTPITGITGTSTTVTGLTNGTGYTFTVTGNNGLGAGPESAPSAVITPNGKYVTQEITVVRPAGTLEIAEACATGGTLDFGLYPQTCAVNLGTGVLDPTATYYDASGVIETVSVRDLRDVDAGWNVNAQITDFVGVTPGNDFPGACLGFTPAATELSNTPLYTQQVTAGAATTPTCVDGAGLETNPVVLSASAGGGLGRADVNGPLALKIPVSAPADTYSAILTFTVI